jgi:hypothetical protein
MEKHIEKMSDIIDKHSSINDEESTQSRSSSGKSNGSTNSQSSKPDDSTTSPSDKSRRTPTKLQLSRRRSSRGGKRSAPKSSNESRSGKPSPERKRAPLGSQSSNANGDQSNTGTRSTDEWNVSGTGLGLVATGAIGLGFAAATVATAGGFAAVGILGGTATVMSGATGLAGVTVGTVQLLASYSASDREERRLNRQFDRATGIAFGVSSSPGGGIGALVGATAYFAAGPSDPKAAVTYINRGATIGDMTQSVGEFGITLHGAFNKSDETIDPLIDVGPVGYSTGTGLYSFLPAEEKAKLNPFTRTTP